MPLYIRNPLILEAVQFVPTEEGKKNVEQFLGNKFSHFHKNGAMYWNAEGHIDFIPEGQYIIKRDEFDFVYMNHISFEASYTQLNAGEMNDNNSN